MRESGSEWAVLGSRKVVAGVAFMAEGGHMGWAHGVGTWGGGEGGAQVGG